MKILFRFFPAFIIIIFYFSFAYAQDVADSGDGEIRSCGVSKDVTVDLPEDTGYCDIYQRQIDYKDKAKALRDSLETRRVAYEAKHFKALEQYRKNLNTIYEEDSKKFQDALQEAEKKQNKTKIDKKKSDEDTSKDMSAPRNEKESDQETKVSENKEGQNEEAGGITEKDYPPEENETGEVVKKRVIMPDDAPEFEDEPF